MITRLHVSHVILRDCGGCVSFRFLPESARWLLTQGRRERAIKEIRRAARVNGREVSQELLDKVIKLLLVFWGGAKSHMQMNDADFKALASFCR